MIKLTAKNYKGVAKPNRREWPKYSTQLMNLAGQNSQATRPKHIGSLKETWMAMRSAGIAGTLKNWEAYYNKTQGVARLKAAGKKIHEQLVKMGIEWIDESMCVDYVKEAVYNKTHMGLGGEEMAIEAAANYFGKPFRYSTAQEESQGIDGFIDGKPVQVKPEGSAFKAHVHNHADQSTQLVITYEEKKKVCYIHNPEFITGQPNDLD